MRAFFASPSFWLPVLLFSACGLRGAYAFVLIANPELDSVAADVVLIELPTFLWLAATSIVVLLWCVLLLFPRRRSFWALFYSFNTVIFLIFIGFVVAFALVKEHTRTPCGGRLPVVQDQRAKKAVFVAYQAFVAAVALLLAVLGASSVSMHSREMFASFKLRSQSQTRADQEKRYQLRRIAIAAIVALGLLLHGIFLLLLALKRPGIVYLYIVLFVLEAAPAIAISSALRKDSPQRSVSSSSSATASPQVVSWTQSSTTGN